MSHDRGAGLAVTLTGGVLALQLNRPDKRNALDSPLIEALHVALERAELDAEVRVVCLRGAGRDFCAGADLAEVLASRVHSLAENEQSALRLGEVFLRIRQLEKPVVAVVHGRALGGGAGLATACDLVVMAASATLGYPEVQRGFVPAMVMTLLRRLTGERVAFDLVATSRVLGADEARALGLVTRVVPDDALAEEVQVVLEALCAADPTALALTKRLLYDLDGRSFEDGIRAGARVNALARATPGFHRAVEQFLA